MTNIEKVNEFLDKAGLWFFLTTDGTQPKGRPFRFHLLKDDKIYFGTGTFKKVFRQIQQNPRVEVFASAEGKFMHYDGTVVFEKDDTLAKEVLANAPQLQKIYNDETGYKLGMFHLENGHVEICSAVKTIEEFDL